MNKDTVTIIDYDVTNLGSISNMLNRIGIETNVTSDFNYEIEYYYSSSLSASLGLYYSSSFLITDLDSETTYVSSGPENAFYVGCENTDDSTVSDEANIYTNQSPAVEVTITSPTQLVTTDSPDTPLDVV